MHREEDNVKSGLISYAVTPEKMHRTLHDSGSARREMKTLSQEIKRKVHSTPQHSPDKLQKTPQSSGSFRRDIRLQQESSKRKAQTPQNESLEKIQKTHASGKFVNALIGQWSKHMGVPTPLLQPGGDSPMVEEMKRMCVTEERKVQLLQKKLQAAEETISAVSASRDSESRAKEEILRQLNTDWESITKYYYEISESLKEFQRHKDNLSTLYNDVILKQQTVVKKLQQELSDTKLKDEEQKSIVAVAECKVVNQERRIQELAVVETELKKQLEEIRATVILEKNHLVETHRKERLELSEKLTSVNEELQLQLKNISGEKQSLINVLEEKEKEMTKLQEEILAQKSKTEVLLCQNAELGEKYDKWRRTEKELSTQLDSKNEEINRLRDNLNARQEIESSLAKDLDLIGKKYKIMQNDFASVEAKLKETQTRNSDLENSIYNMRNINQNAEIELYKKIEISETEKEQILLEKNRKIQELENSYKSLEEKYKLDTTALKEELNTKLSDMNTAALQNSAFVRLNETLNKMTEENKKRETRQHNTKENQENLKEKSQSLLEPNLMEVNKAYGVGSQQKLSQTRETKEQKLLDKQKIGTPKRVHKSKEEEQDVYSFNPKEAYELPQILSQTRLEKRLRFESYSQAKASDSTKNSPFRTRDKNAIKPNVGLQEQQEQKKEDCNISPKKKIFKTRGSGLRQYGAPRKLFKK